MLKLNGDVKMKIAFLGSSSALSSSTRDYTSLAVNIFDQWIMIDCGGSPVKKLSLLGIDYMKIDTVLITHTHPDHVYGLPAIIHEMLLRKRQKSLNIYCPEAGSIFLKELFQIFFRDEKEMFEIDIHPVKVQPQVIIEKNLNYEIYGIAVDHGIEAFGYKILEKGGKSLVYSGDTRPSQNLIRKAIGADLLIHECTYSKEFEKLAEEGGHSTSYQVGEIARKANVKKLILTHINPISKEREDLLLVDAKICFAGEVSISKDMLLIEV